MNEENNINKGIIQKNMNRKIIIIAGSILFLFLLFAGYQLYALNTIDSQNLKIESIGMNKNLELTLSGNGELINPSFIPVTIKKIDYAGYIKNEQVFNGTIPEVTIPAQSSVEFSFTAISAWVPDEETVLEVIAGKEVILTVKTNAKVSYLYLFTLTGEEQTETNIAKKLKPFIEDQLAAVSERVLEYLK